MTITAKYENGVFKPLERVSVAEGTLVEVNVPSIAERLKTKSPPIGDSPFFGIWKDRDDIGDSAEYVARMRRDLRG